MALKNTGMPIKDIKQYVEWCMAGDSTLKERLACIKTQKKVVETQMEKLKQYLELLDYKQWYYETALEAGTTAIHKQTNNCRTAKRTPPEIYTAL
jgi:DNA-binding transcriptional MerR regulator